jgi:hypothetical protein
MVIGNGKLIEKGIFKNLERFKYHNNSKFLKISIK